MLKFSRISANSVVVKLTRPSSSRGMFIRVSFLYANRFGHLFPNPNGGAMFFSMSNISVKCSFPLETITKQVSTTRPSKPCHNHNLRRRRIVLGPNPNELVQMMRAQNTGVPRQVVKVVHDDGDEQVQHLRG